MGWIEELTFSKREVVRGGLSFVSTLASVALGAYAALQLWKYQTKFQLRREAAEKCLAALDYLSDQLKPLALSSALHLRREEDASILASQSDVAKSALRASESALDEVRRAYRQSWLYFGRPSFDQTLRVDELLNDVRRDMPERVKIVAQPGLSPEEQHYVRAVPRYVAGVRDEVARMRDSLAERFRTSLDP